MADKNSNEKLLYCSFCGKSQHEVQRLIAGPQVFICNECVELCNDIIREELEKGVGDAASVSEDRPLPTPQEIRAPTSTSLARTSPRRPCRWRCTTTTSV